MLYLKIRSILFLPFYLHAFLLLVLFQWLQLLAICLARMLT